MIAAIPGNRPVDAAREVFATYAASIDTDELQARLHRWQNGQFGHVTLEHDALGVSEEVGELHHAILKHAYAVRGMGDEDAFRAKAGDAVADTAIFLMHVCTHLRLDFWTLVNATAEVVMRRDYRPITLPTAPCPLCGSSKIKAELDRVIRCQSCGKPYPKVTP